MIRATILIPLMVAVAVSLAACQTGRDPAAMAASQTYFASQVRVSRGPQFSTGFKLLGDESADALARRFSDEVRARLTAKLKAVMKGRKPARVDIVLKEVSIASKAERVLLASGSTVSATVRIVDVKTGAVLAEREIRAIDKAQYAHLNINGIPLDVVAMAVVNLQTASTDRRIAAITNAFVNKVELWVKPR